MSLGIKKAKSDIIAFFDSDLTDLKNSHTEALIKPLISNKDVSGVIGLIPDALSPLKPISGFLNLLSGQRAYFRKDLLPHVEKLKSTRRGVEVYLNSVFKNKKIVYVTLHGLGHVYKFEKTDFIGWVEDYLVQGVEVIKALLNK